MCSNTPVVLVVPVTVSTGSLLASAGPSTMNNRGILEESESSGAGANHSGPVTGWSATPGEVPRHAFLYAGTALEDGQMSDLDAWLDANNPAGEAKWTLAVATGLTGTGLITGKGNSDDGPGGLNDGNRAFVLDASSSIAVPEPVLSLLLLRLVATLSRRC